MRTTLWLRGDEDCVVADDVWDIDIRCPDVPGPIDRIEATANEDRTLLALWIGEKQYLLYASELALALEGGKIDGAILV